MQRVQISYKYTSLWISWHTRQKRVYYKHKELDEINFMPEIEILKIHNKKIWVPLGVVFEGLGVQMMPRCPAG